MLLLILWCILMIASKIYINNGKKETTTNNITTAKVSLKTIFSIPLLVNEDDEVGLPKPVPLD